MASLTKPSMVVQGKRPGSGVKLKPLLSDGVLTAKGQSGPVVTPTRTQTLKGKKATPVTMTKSVFLQVSKAQSFNVYYIVV